MRLHQARDAGADPEPPVSEEVHRRDVDADAARALGVVPEREELPPDVEPAKQHPRREHGDCGRDDGEGDLRKVPARGLVLEEDHPVEPPVREVVDRDPAREEHEEAEEHVEGGDGHHDRDDPEVVDEGRVERAEEEAEGHRERDAGYPAPAAKGHDRERREVLDHRRADRERDVDAARDEHDQESRREDEVDGADVEEVEEVDEGEEGVGGKAEGGADDDDDDEEPPFGRGGHRDPRARAEGAASAGIRVKSGAGAGTGTAPRAGAGVRFVRGGRALSHRPPLPVPRGSSPPDGTRPRCARP